MWDKISVFLNNNAGVVTAIGFLGAALVAGVTVAWRALSHIYNFRKLQEEHDRVKKQHDAEEQRNKQLEREIAEMKEISVFGRWHYYPHDSPPRMPVCPVCHLDGKNMRMRAYYVSRGHPGQPSRRELHFACDRCSLHFHPEEWENDLVLSLLEIDMDKVRYFEWM